MYKVILSKAAQKDKAFLKAANLDKKAKELLDILVQDPFQTPPPYETLVGSLKGFYYRRINFQHRLVYKVIEEAKTVHVLRMWTHYE